MDDKPTVMPGTSGSARVEYFACREDVDALLAKGYSARMVYEQMKEQGRMTCSYSAFCDYVRGNGTRQHSRGKRKPFAGLVARSQQTSDKQANSENRFIRPQDLAHKPLI